MRRAGAAAPVPPAALRLARRTIPCVVHRTSRSGCVRRLVTDPEGERLQLPSDAAIRYPDTVLIQGAPYAAEPSVPSEPGVVLPLSSIWTLSPYSEPCVSGRGPTSRARPGEPGGTGARDRWGPLPLENFKP